MLDLGWQELVVVACVLVLVVGPKDLPRVLKAVAGMVGKARRMGREFQSSMMEVANQEEFRDVRKAIDDARSGRIEAFDDIREAIEDTGGAIAGGSGAPRPALRPKPAKGATKGKAAKSRKPKSGKPRSKKGAAGKTRARKPRKGRAAGTKKAR